MKTDSSPHEEVYEELKVRDDDAAAWAKARSDSLIVATTESITVGVKEILHQFPRLVGELKGRNRADAFVIAVARQLDAAVVTGELGGTAGRPKIPYICEQLGIECITFLDLIKGEGWQYG